MVDVYIPRGRKSSNKDTAFAFVRYKFESESLKAIEKGNNRRIDGWYIRVKKASYGWKEWRTYVKRWAKKNDEVAS